MYPMQICCFEAKQPNLKLRTCPKQLTGSQVLLVLSGTVRYQEGSKKHIYDSVLNGDFPAIHCLDIVSSVLGIVLAHIGKYMSKI